MKQANRIAALTILAACTAALAQEAKPAPTPAPQPLLGSIASHPNWPVAKPEDVNSLGAILDAVYNVISGPKGQARDWDRMRSLFIPDARLIPARLVPTPILPGPAHADSIILTIDGYIARSSANMTTNGFFEHGVHNEIPAVRQHRPGMEHLRVAPQRRRPRPLRPRHQQLPTPQRR
jgi:hypothetical protein